jgi:excinuclease UvrABC nuclease subunit
MTDKLISQIDWIGNKTAARLLDHGYRSTDELSDATAQELVQIEGIGIGKATRLLDEPRESEAIAQ